ncbi:MAG: 2-oxoacid:acceptor oxidoreductase family protein [Planctomycetes bacterium]|nr:2-oxoacid:acceptor oxidoreductase family protein [Planctomycetota bacterium]
MTHADFFDDAVAHPFCPGCSHGTVVDALGVAMERAAPDSMRTVLVSDIGCVGLLDRHFKVHTFHGLHGRSVTYATGLKLARPELTVVVALGDGSLGIGGHHLIQAARRGTPITVVVFNNFNYGMTGGQASSTTPVGAFTSTTPDGATDRPLDPCALAMAAGATFVARTPAFAPDLAETLARAVRHPGFAIVDVWEICTAHFMPANDFKRTALVKLAETLGLSFGVLLDAPPAPRPHEIHVEPPARIDLTPAFGATLDRPVRIVVAGSAGQRIRSAAMTFARAAVRSGLFATQKDDYPITVRTGHSVAELVVSPRPVGFTGIEAPDVAVLLAPEGLRRVRPMLAAMNAAGIVLADDALDLPPVAARVVRLPLRAVAKDVGAENVALWALAQVARTVGAPPVAALEDVIRRHTPEAYRGRALRAVAPAAESG